MSALDDYVGRCKGLVLRAAEDFPGVVDIEWPMHLIDHDEAAEGILDLARQIASIGALPDEWVDALREAMGDLVPEDAIPAQLRHPPAD